METIIFADNQVLLAKTEDDLQRSIYSLSKVVTLFSMEISTQKSEVIHLKVETLF
jgi:hypothetical protein